MRYKVLATLLLASFLITGLYAQSQNQTELSSTKKQFINKNGFVIVPEQGDFAIGINANPFFDYLGNFLKISDVPNYAPNFGFTAENPGMIYGKYMVSENMAYIAAVRIGYSSTTLKDGAGIDSDEVDKTSISATNFGVTAGIEHSPIMKSRIRGFYGYQASLGLKPYSGNSFANPGQIVTGKVSYEDGSRDINNYVERGGATIGLGVAGIVGVEYFILPKLSLRGQFNVSLGFDYQMERKYEPRSGAEIIIDAGMSEFNLDNIASGNMAVLFYF